MPLLFCLLRASGLFRLHVFGEPGAEQVFAVGGRFAGRSGVRVGVILDAPALPFVDGMMRPVPAVLLKQVEAARVYAHVPQPSRLRAMLLIEHGLALDEMGKSQDALAAFQEAKRLAPEEPLTQFYGGADGPPIEQQRAGQVALLKVAIQRAKTQ